MNIEKKETLIGTTIRSDYSIVYTAETSIIEDGKVLSSKTYKRPVNPVGTYDDLPEQVKEITSKLWTPDVVANYKATKDAQQKELDDLLRPSPESEPAPEPTDG